MTQMQSGSGHHGEAFRLTRLPGHNPAGPELHHGDTSTGPADGARRDARLPLVAAPRLVPAAGYRATLRSVLVGPSVTPRIMRSPTILVFDSGVGGLTVFREIARARPDARFVYAADDALFPYGKVPEAELVDARRRPDGRADRAHRPDLVVIACNTASTLVLPALRERFALPFVGTVPAIKPACAASQSKRVSVLGTEATVAREYTHALIRNFGQGCDLTLVGSARLAALAEAALAGEPVGDDGDPRRDRALLRRGRRRAHRHDRARLHALPAAARPLRAARALAGALDRSGARDRAPRGRAGRPATGEAPRRRRPARSSPRAARPPPDLAAALAEFRA